MNSTAHCAITALCGFLSAEIAGADLVQTVELGGIIIFWLRVEHRLTRMETIISIKHKNPADDAPGGLGGS